MYNKGFKVLLNAFIINILFLVIQDNLYARKYSRKFWYIFSCIFGTNLLFWATIPPVPFLYFFCLILLLLTMSSLLYKEKIRVFIICDLVVVILSIFLDILMSSIVSMIYKQSLREVLNNAQFFAIINITVLLSYFVTILIGLKRVTKKNFDGFVMQEIIILLISMILDIFLVMYVTVTNSGNNSFIIILTVCIILALFCIQLYSFGKSASYNRKLRISEMQLMQLDFILKNYGELKEENDKMEKVLHDIRNHVSTLSGMITLCKEEGIETYKDTVEESIKIHLTKFEFDNQVLEVIINNKKQICDINGIELSINIREEGLEIIEPYDLTIILGNLLDNAIEESINTEKKRIEIRIFKYEFFLVIHIRNNCNREFFEKERRGVKSTKKGHFGIGIHNVKSTVKKYNGTIDFKIEKNEFLVDIFIPLA